MFNDPGYSVENLVNYDYLSKEWLNKLDYELKLLGIEWMREWLLSGFDVVNDKLIYQFKPIPVFRLSTSKSGWSPVTLNIMNNTRNKNKNYQTWLNQMIQKTQTAITQQRQDYQNKWQRPLLLPKKLFEAERLHAIILDHPSINIPSFPPFIPGQFLKYLYIDNTNLRKLPSLDSLENFKWIKLKIDIPELDLDLSRLNNLKYLSFENKSASIDKSIEQNKSIVFLEIKGELDNIDISNMNELKCIISPVKIRLPEHRRDLVNLALYRPMIGRFDKFEYGSEKFQNYKMDIEDLKNQIKSDYKFEWYSNRAKIGKSS